MEMYAFIHYSLNTYTDQEWGFGNEDPQLFNPSNLHFFFSSPKQMMIDWDTEQTFTTFRYLPPQASKEGTVTHYTLWASTDWANWTKVAQGEFSNVVNNPIWQTVTFPPVRAKIFRFDADRLAEGERMAFDDFDICANNQ